MQMNSNEQDRLLVEKARSGDSEAYRKLVEKYQNRAYAIAFEVLRSREDAEDVVQESFVKAYLSLESFRGDSSFYTWFYRIVYNMAIDVKRRIKRRGGNKLEYQDEIQGEHDPAAAERHVETPDQTLTRKYQSARIARAMQGLSEEHRTVIMLREIDGLSYEEIAKVVGISRGTVMSRLHYARKRMQKELSDLKPEQKQGGDRQFDSSKRSKESGRLRNTAVSEEKSETQLARRGLSFNQLTG
ncbi:MAG: sigma-70 family RNA polymerase sigma factor [Candidatus Dadabacteria bacterium]|nr:MAG: sigma-70 family RNA polymerase sigma factor [Candidatus Dadabacteria bacterium]